MKKVLGFIFVLGAIFGSSVFACQEVEMDDATVCIDIEKDDETYTLDSEITDTNGSVSLRCDVLLPNNQLKYVGACNGEFEYDGEGSRKIKIYIQVNGENDSIEEYYDFDDGEWTDGGSSSSSNGDLDNFYISLSDSTPAEDDEVTLTIKARDEDNDTVDDYDGDAEIEVEYRTSSSSTWQDALDSNKADIDDATPSFDEGIAETDITFNYEYEYRITVTDEDEDIDDYKDIDVGGSSSSSNGDLDNFYISLSDSTPAEDDEVTLTIKARDEDNDTVDDYDGDPEIEVEYRTSSSSTWQDALDSNKADIDDTTPSFDEGIAETDITFNYEYEYRITVTDEDEDIDDYKDIDVGGSSSSSNGDLDNFYISLSDSTPAEDDEVTLTIKARDEDNSTVDDYDGDPEITVEYKSTSSSSRRDASSTYISIDDKTPSFDDGIAETDITFKYEYEYRITVTDEDEDIDDYKDIDVGGSSSSSDSDLDNLYLSSDDTTPTLSQYVDLRIKARDEDDLAIEEYDGSVEFKVYYRTSSSSSWVITTSSTYYEIDSDYEDGYDFDSDDDGYATLSDFIKFKKSYDYKIKVTDSDDDDIYKEITFDVGGSSSTSNGDLDNFYLTTDDTTPSLSQYVDLKIKARDDDDNTVEDYDGTVEFKVYYRTSSSSSWVSTTSSTYYEIDSDYEDGYEFETSDDGYATLSDFIKFKKSYDYKVKVTDSDDSSIYKEITFDVGGTSTSDDDEDNFKVTITPEEPETNERVDITVSPREGYDVITNYAADIKFEIRYQTSNSSTWLVAPSSYYTINTTNSWDDDYNDSVEFKSYRQGNYKFNDFIKFNKNYNFKVIVTDVENEDMEGYDTVDITQYSDSSIDGFTSSELIQVERMYDMWENLIDQLKREYDNLDNSTYRQDLSDDLYYELGRIIEDEDGRYEDYDEFNAAFLNWYRYTINIR